LTDVQFRVESQTGIITLDRPHTLNALNLAMITAIRAQLLDWMQDSKVAMVIIESRHKRAFCAGGDLMALYNALNAQDMNLVEQLFRQEYALNYLIRSYPKPYIAFIDGIVMGGGIGLSVHGTYRILGDHVTAAMPETNLGFFPDIGASIILNKCPGRLGLYLGLTGIHMDTADTLYSRMGTHYVPSAHHPYLKDKLITCPQKSKETILSLIQAFQRSTPKVSQFESQQADVDHLFEGNSLQEILSNLASAENDLAHGTLALLNKRSPTSLKITFELLRRGKSLTIAEAVQLDFALSQKCVHLPDFKEGIRATIVDKDKSPHWQPSHVNDVSDDFILSLFEQPSVPLELEWLLLKQHE
jgi:enoyl-CoA hydratase/carnithine racemase